MARISPMSSVGRLTAWRTIIMVTRPADGIPAAPIAAAVAVILVNLKINGNCETKEKLWSSNFPSPCTCYKWWIKFGVDIWYREECYYSKLAISKTILKSSLRLTWSWSTKSCMRKLCVTSSLLVVFNLRSCDNLSRCKWNRNCKSRLNRKKKLEIVIIYFIYR